MSWVIRNTNADINHIVEKFNVSPLNARIMANRGITNDKDVKMFLHGTVKDMHDPMLMTDMEKAVKLLNRAVDTGKNIRIIGDYDVDGVCATTVLFKCIKKAGGKVSAVIPHRIKDGYGLNDRLIEQAKKDDVDLIITCDNGIAAIEQIKLANELGMAVIITDHHEAQFKEEYGNRIEELPPAFAVVDPHRELDAYPYKGICGAVVAWKFMQAFGINEDYLYNLMDIIALATVADVMDLKDENRIIVKEGLKLINSSEGNPGIKALRNRFNCFEANVYTLGFEIGPCINAAGRLDSAKPALSLLLKEHDGSQKATDAIAELAEKLYDLNAERKGETEKGIEKAKQYLQEHGLDNVIVLYLPDIHESIVGIVAGKIKELYHRPTLCFTKTENGIIKGSGRSIEAYDMFTELSRHKALYLSFGGHKMAAGVSVNSEEELDMLRKFLNEECVLSDKDFQPKIVIDAVFPTLDFTIPMVDEISILEPFGNGNPAPLFAEKGVRLTYAKILGMNKNAIKFSIKDEKNRAGEMMYFGNAEIMKGRLTDICGSTGEAIFTKMTLGTPVDVAYTPQINTFRGSVSIQNIIHDVKA